MSETQIPVNVTISSEQMDKAIIDSLMGAQMGKTIAQEIEKSFGNGYGRIDVDRMVKTIVEKQIHNAVEKAIATDHEEKLKAFVAEKLTDEFLTALFEAMWRRFSDSRYS